MEKIKLRKLLLRYCTESDRGKDILVVIIIILVGLGSFGLGRLSKNTDNPGMNIEYKDQGANIIESLSESGDGSQDAQKSNSKSFFASSRGSKYYSLGCFGGRNIKQENRIYFTTSGEAEKAGYELSSSCK